MGLWNIFSQSVASFFILLVVFLWSKVYFGAVQFIFFFSFLYCAFGVMSKNSLPNPVVLNRDDFDPQGTFENVWRHF